MVREFGDIIETHIRVHSFEHLWIENLRPGDSTGDHGSSIFLQPESFLTSKCNWVGYDESTIL